MCCRKPAKRHGVSVSYTHLDVYKRQVICSDKTGTLTENRMTVTVIDVAGHSLELTGTSHPAPALDERHETPIRLAEQPPAIGLAIAGGALCNDASLQPDPQTGRYGVIGDPTEGALLVAALQAGIRPVSYTHLDVYKRQIVAHQKKNLT